MDDCQACLLGKFPCLMEDKILQKYKKSMSEAMPLDLVVCEEMVKKKTMAALFLHGADKTQYGVLKGTLIQNMSIGTNQYPQATEEALNIHTTYSQT